MLVPAFCMMSCSSSKYLGTYSFQMGKDKGTHLAAVMTLTGEEVLNPASPNKEVLGNKFTFTADLQTGGDSSMANEIIDIIYQILGGEGKDCIEGYYRIGDPIKDKQRLMRVGFVIDSEIIQAIVELAKTAGYELPDGFSLSPDFIENIFYSSIDTKSIYMTIPVSMNDLMFQIYWYGYDIYVDDTIHIDHLPETQRHYLGSHPTTEEVAYINADPTYKAHHPETTFKDYHTLTVSLLKE